MGVWTGILIEGESKEDFDQLCEFVRADPSTLDVAEVEAFKDRLIAEGKAREL